MEIAKNKTQKKKTINMADIVIYCTSNATQTGVVISDRTDWSSIGGSLASLASITLSLYSTSLVTPTYQYNLTALEVDEYTSNGTIEILFTTIMGASYLTDGWWNGKITANSDAYISNYSGFGIYSSITFAVFNEINGLHVPENIKYVAEKYCTYAMWLEGLKYLDTTNVNSRDIKFNKRLLSLQKMLLKI